jgi:response regulator RpfG family c-di-GMP phosphodiesterase
MMLEIDGCDSVRAFREMKKASPNVAILVVSVVPFDRTRDMFMKEGALGYVVKPFNQFSFEPVRQKLVRVFHELAV